MPIVITPSGEYINSETGNPVNLPPQRPDIPQTMGQQTGAALTPEEREMIGQSLGTADPLGTSMIDPRSVARREEIESIAGARARENIPTGSALTEGEMDDVAKVQMLVDMGLSPTDAMEAVAREKQMNPNPINPEAFSGGAVAPSTVENPAGMIAQGDPSMGAMGALPIPRGATDMGMPENGIVADLMRRGYSPDMIASMTGGNMPPREDDAMNLERTGPPTITPMR
jgi:hypothetical protein